MHILAITDGTKETSEAISLLDDYAQVDLQLISRLSQTPPKPPSLVVVALSKCNERILNALAGLLETHFKGLRNRLVLCVSINDKAHYASRLKLFSAEVVSLPTDQDRLFRAIKKADPTFKLQSKNAVLAAKATQTLSNTLSTFLANDTEAQEHCLEMILESTATVDSAITEFGFDEWMAAVAEHHSYTARHCMIVAGFASQWGETLGFSKADRPRFTEAALLHDVGKVAIPLEILDKPSRLTEEERSIIEIHPTEGLKILEKNPKVSQLAKDITLSHHELLDGSGYPNGIAGDEISDPVRCSTIIDVYSALVDTRAYKHAMVPFEAYRVMTSMKGKLDPHLLDAFRPIVEMHHDTLKQAA
jgi:putative nucleotidyltransferase with HDIG domain